jgi:hypothetical protein
VSDLAALLGDVSPQRLRADVDRLAAFGTRHSLSETEHPERGIGAARRWLRDAFSAAGDGAGRDADLALRVSFDAHSVEPSARVPQPAEIVNVVCEIPGVMPEARARRHVVVAHYDSRATDALDAVSDAPRSRATQIRCDDRAARRRRRGAGAARLAGIRRCGGGWRWGRDRERVRSRHDR